MRLIERAGVTISIKKMLSMQLRHTYRVSFFSLLFCALLLGCSEDKKVALDRDDIHFAEFYSDYLLHSGVTVSSSDQALVALETSEISELLVSHALTPESFHRKSELYRNNPSLWQLVLLQIRANIQNKPVAAQ